MGFASLEEDIQKRAEDAAVMDGPTHPSILAYRANPSRKRNSAKKIKRKKDNVDGNLLNVRYDISFNKLQWEVIKNFVLSKNREISSLKKKITLLSKSNISLNEKIHKLSLELDASKKLELFYKNNYEKLNREIYQKPILKFDHNNK